MRGDHECPYINLRIIANRPDFGYSIMKIQILSFVFSTLQTERLIAVSKLEVIAETEIKVPRSTLEPNLF